MLLYKCTSPVPSHSSMSTCLPAIVCHVLEGLPIFSSLGIKKKRKKKEYKKKDRCGSKNIPVCSKEGMFFSHQTRKKKKKRWFWLACLSVPAFSVHVNFAGVCLRRTETIWQNLQSRHREGFKFCLKASWYWCRVANWTWKKNIPSVNICREYLHQQTTEVEKNKGVVTMCDQVCFLGPFESLVPDSEVPEIKCTKSKRT